jgi:lipopolysaccharide/colanic/teichoic acid biosynthesis glycosyltransferase
MLTSDPSASEPSHLSDSLTQAVMGEPRPSAHPRARLDFAWRSYGLVLLLVDAALLGLAFFGAARLRVDVLPLQEVPFDPLVYTFVAAAVIPGVLVVFWLRHAYDRRYLLAGPDEYARIFSGCTYGTLLVVAASYLYGSSPVVSRAWLFLFWVLAIALVCSGRFALRRAAHALRRRGLFVRRVLIAGANDQGLAILEQLHGPAQQGVEVVGFLDDYLAVGSCLSWRGSQVTVHGHPYEAEAVAAVTGADLLIVVPAALTWETQRVLSHIGQRPDASLEVRLAPTQYDLTAVGVEAAPLGFIPLLRMQSVRIVGTEAVLHAAVDLTLAAVLLLFLAPFVAAMMLLARLRGVSPLLLHRPILGQGGQITSLNLLNDRVSDRLLLRGVPSLVSVLSGKLSLVGPRPVLVGERPVQDGWDEVLLAVKPGLTGPWRLVAPTASLEEIARADVWWVRNWTIWQDLFVLFQTARFGMGPGRPHDIQRWTRNLMAQSAAAPSTRPQPAAATVHSNGSQA